MADADAGTRQAAPAATSHDGTEAKPGTKAEPGNAVTKPPTAGVATSDRADTTHPASAANHNGSVPQTATPQHVTSQPATKEARHASGGRPSPDDLLAEIESTREDLARTIDAISDRISPASNARRAAAQIRQQLAKIDPVMAGAAAAAAVTAAAAIIAWRSRRRRRR